MAECVCALKVWRGSVGVGFAVGAGAEEGVEFGTCEVTEHALLGRQPGADEGRALQFVLELVHAEDGGVVLLPSIFALLLFQHAVGEHLLRRLVDDGGQIHLLSLGLLLQHWELLHDLVIFVALLDQVVSIGPEQPVDLCISTWVPSSISTKSSLGKNSLMTLEMR